MRVIVNPYIQVLQTHSCGGVQMYLRFFFFFNKTTLLQLIIKLDHLEHYYIRVKELVFSIIYCTLALSKYQIQGAFSYGQ